MKLPFTSVSMVSQDVSVFTRRPPVTTLSPPWNVLVALPQMVVVLVVPTVNGPFERMVVAKRFDVVAFPIVMRSAGKVYVPEPANVPGVVVMTPVPELYEMTEAPESDVLEILLLKVLKSVEER